MLNLKLAIYAFVGLLISGSSYASLNCSAHPSCEAMGYSKTETCENGSLIYCPFDTSYKKCITATQNIDCEELGYLYDTGDAMDWCAEYVYCPSDSSYIACVELHDCESMGFVPDEMNENGEYMWEWCSNTIYCPTDWYYVACADSAPYINCYSMGFNSIDKSDWCDELIYCPTDSSLTLCANSCDAYELTSCPYYSVCDTCDANGTTKYKLTGCDSTHCMTNNSCSYNVCDYSTYPVSAKPYGGTAKGNYCYGYRKNYGGTCSSSSAAYYYSDIQCNYGYEKIGTYCKKTEYACEGEYYSCTGDCENMYGWDSGYYWELRECNEECSNSSCECYRDVYCDDCYGNNENCNLCSQYENSFYY